jgi:RimJ/RimL family protein N-acetyltransferase
VAVLLERHVTLRDGEKVLIRPLKPEDAALYPDFLSEVTAEDLRLRFFVPMREVRHELIEKLIHYDPKHAMAFIAIGESTNRMLGVVRLHDDTEDDGAEFAILVRSHLKGHGLGWLMMKHMIAYAPGRKRHHAADVLRAGIPRQRRRRRTRHEGRYAAFGRTARAQLRRFRASRIARRGPSPARR